MEMLMADTPIAPTKTWANFFEKFKEIDTLPIHQWKERHILYYMLTEYQKHYGYPYIFSYEKAPTSSAEMHFAKLIPATSGSSNPKIWKAYVDWVFEYKVKPKKYKITSLGFLLTRGFGNEFQAYWKKQNTITRSTILPDEFLILLKAHGVEAETYGEIAFIVQAAKNLTPAFECYRTVVRELEFLGLNTFELEELK